LEEGVSAWSSTRFFRIAERKQLEELLDAQGAIAPAAIAADALASGLVQPASASTAAAPDGNRELAMAAPASPAVSIDGLVAAGAFLGAGVVPTGAVLPFAGPASAVPQGWLLCDGLELDPDTHPQLYAVLGTAHGGNAPFSFRIPDYRGFFLRGVDGGAGVDPDASTRLAMAPGGNTGNAVGSVQLHQFQTHSHSTTSHSHTINPGGNHQHGVLGDTAPNIYLRLNDDGGASGVNSVDSSNESGNVGPIVTTFSGSHGHSASSNSGTVTDPNSGSHGSETRPENVYVNFIIRCGPGDAC
jgi:microcystin-dependent protein